MSKAYLMWVGHKHYKTWADFETECLVLGLSKRVADTKTALLVRDKPVYLAHDEGVTKKCPKCDGTGGKAWVDGDVWMFRRYRKHKAHLARKNRKKDNPLEGKKVYGTQPCGDCSGRGLLPQGKVYGFFIPDNIEYILKGDELQEVKDKAKEQGIDMLESIAGESKRGCGYRKTGGTYLTTKPSDDRDSRRVQDLIAELSEAGLVDPARVEVKGSLAVFQDPIDIPGVKRFRGIKKWQPTEEIEAERVVTQMNDGQDDFESMWG